MPHAVNWILATCTVANDALCGQGVVGESSLGSVPVGPVAVAPGEKGGCTVRVDATVHSALCFCTKPSFAPAFCQAMRSAQYCHCFI